MSTRGYRQGEDGAGSSVLKHPDKDLIAQKLLQGQSTREVEQWLKRHYASSPRNWLSYATLQKYRNNFLNVAGETLREIQKERVQQRKLEKLEEQKQVTKATVEYQTAKTEAAQKIIDVSKDLIYIHDKVLERISKLEGLEVSHHNDRAIVGYIQQLRSLLMDYHTYLKEAEDDSKSDYSINVERVKQQVEVMKQVLFETLLEVDQSVAKLFFDKLKAKLAQLAQGEFTPATPSTPPSLPPTAPATTLELPELDFLETDNNE